MDNEDIKKLATQIIEDGYAESKSEDDVKMDMFAAKVPFSKLNSLYKTISIELGHIVDPKEVTEGINALLADIPWADFEEWDQAEPAIDHIVENVNGATPQRALSLVRAYCKTEEIDLPKKPKATGGGGGGARSSKLANAIVQAVLDGVTSKEDAYAIINPLVGGKMKHKNTLYYVNTTFAICLAVKTETPLTDVMAELKEQADPAGADPVAEAVEEDDFEEEAA